MLSVISPAFQAISIASGIGKAATEKRVAISRVCNLTSLAAVTGDFATQYLHDGSPAHLSGVLSFSVLTARTALNLLCQFNEYGRRLVTAAAAVTATVLSVGGQLYFKGHYDPVTLLSMGGVWIGCYADYTNDMAKRRFSFLLMGLSTSLFGTATHAWGLVGKNLIADAGSSAFFIWRYKDPIATRPITTLKNWFHPQTTL